MTSPPHSSDLLTMATVLFKGKTMPRWWVFKEVLKTPASEWVAIDKIPQSGD